MPEISEELEKQVDEFLHKYDDTVISRSRVVNPLLGIWKLASDIDPAVAGPVEQLLTTLGHRQVVSGTELEATMDEVRKLLLEHPETATV